MNSTPSLLTLLHPCPCEQQRGIGNRGCHQSTTTPLCCSLLTIFPWSGVGTCHGLQSFMKYISVLPFQGLQGNLCSHIWSTLAPPSAPTLVSVGLFLTLFFLTPLCKAVFCSYTCFARCARCTQMGSVVPCGMSIGPGWICCHVNDTNLSTFPLWATGLAQWQAEPMAQAEAAGAVCHMELPPGMGETHFV